MDTKQQNVAALITQLPVDDGTKQALMSKLPEAEAAVREEIKALLEDLAVRFGRMYRELDEAERDFEAKLAEIEADSLQLAKDVADGKTAQELDKVRAQLSQK